MKGIDKITARIEAEGAAEAARLAEETALRCKEIAEAGEAKARERYWQRVKEGAKAAEERGQRLAKTADMEARKSILATKQTIVAETFRLAEEKLLALSGEEYLDFLASLTARASSTGEEEIVLAEKDKALGQKVLSRANALLSGAGKTAKLTLSARTGDHAAGLVLRQGNISVNCTVEALMAQAREEMAAEVASELFA